MRLEWPKQRFAVVPPTPERKEKRSGVANVDKFKISPDPTSWPPLSPPRQSPTLQSRFALSHHHRKSCRRRRCAARHPRHPRAAPLTQKRHRRAASSGSLGTSRPLWIHTSTGRSSCRMTRRTRHSVPHIMYDIDLLLLSCSACMKC